MEDFVSQKSLSDQEVVEGSVIDIPSIYEKICERLKIIAVDVEKVQLAKELLTQMQRRKHFMSLLGRDDENGSLNINPEDFLRISSVHSLKSMAYYGESDESDLFKIEEEEEEDMSDACDVTFDEERWGNHFTGFQILTMPEALDDNENSKCIELSTRFGPHDLQMYLLNGVRCFMLDLFCGALQENQDLIVQLREAEINISKQFSFPVVSTIVAKLSPRYQYTGYLEHNKESLELEKGTRVLITSDRLYSRKCSAKKIYVNARFLMSSCQRFDIIPIGEEIQLQVISARNYFILCCVYRPGTLYSYMPVLFPRRCARYRVSYEELEDLTFAREVGLNIVISNIAGSVPYLDNLEEVMRVLGCENLRLYARVVLNQMLGCDGELNWIAQRYDGFLVELAKPDIVPDIMMMCRNAECFMQHAYAAKKPIIFDAWEINVQHLRVDPSHYYYAFYYPDKFLIKSHLSRQTFYFSFLQSAIFERIALSAIAKMPLCDSSHTGADGLARAAVTASMEMDAKAIIVCGVTTRMVQKISHFRPLAPIIFISQMRSAEDYVSVYHNVTMVSFRTKHFTNHRRNTFQKAIFAVAYLASRKIVRQDERVILVYNYDIGTKFPEKYLIFKFEKHNFVEHLSQSLFPRTKESVQSVCNY